jgi:hypothetical protein
MSQFECKVCDYSTQRSIDLKRHKETKKHLKNLELLAKTLDNASNEDEDQKQNFKCKYCGLEFKHYQSKWKHEKSRCKKNKPELKTSDVKPESNNDSISSSEIVKMLLEQNKNLMEIVKNNSETARKSTSTTSYVIKHFDKAPPVKKLQNAEAIKLLEYDVPSEYTSGDMIIYSYNSKILTKYLGDIIVKTYKKKDPKKQSFWNSDSARLSFIVRQMLDTGNNEWITDKSGIKLTQLIVSPMLDNVKITMQNYMGEKRKMIESEETDGKDTEIMENMTSAGSIIASINKKELHDTILKYIAPHFNLDSKN